MKKIPLVVFKKCVFLFSLPVIISFILTGCDKIDFSRLFKPKKDDKKPPVEAMTVKGTLIARVNNIPITLEELNKMVEIYNINIAARDDLTEEQKNAAKIDTIEKKISYFKEGILRQRVFYQAALDKGLDRKEEIIEILDRQKIVTLATAYQEELVKNLDVSYTDVADAYNMNKDKFKEAETRRIREIVVRTQDEARQILIELYQGADFSSLAKTRSIASSAKDGGDLGYISKEQRGMQFLTFDEVAFSNALQKGSISSEFKGPDGYYIVKIEDIKGGRQIPLAEIQDLIKARLLLGKQLEELDKTYRKLYSEYKIEIHEGEIK